MYFVILLVNFIGDYVLGNLRVVMQGGRAIGPPWGVLVETEDKKFPVVFEDFPEHDCIGLFLPSGHLYFGAALPRLMKLLVYVFLIFS